MVVISMLRAVNLPGYRKISMEALRNLYDSLGCEEAQSYVQSGNVVFRTSERDLEKVVKRIEAGIERTFGFPGEVVARTCAEMRSVVARNPFGARPEVVGSKLLVTFLASDPGESAREAVRAIKTDPEELFAVGSELYIYYPHGAGRTKLPVRRIEKALQTVGTARNWNSVTKMLEMAEKLERQ